MEFIHNILGMSINWTNLMYSHVLNHYNGNIPNIPENKDHIYMNLLDF